MVTAAQQPAGRAIDALAKLATTIVLLLYAVGFLITSLYYADYGFSPTNPFRARVASAGVWFGIMIVVPMFLGRLTFRQFSLLAIAKPWQRQSIFALSLYIASCSGSFLMGAGFQIEQTLRAAVLPLAISGASLVLIVGPIYKWLKRPSLAAVVAGLTVFGLLQFNLVRALMGGQGFTHDALILWFFAVSLAAVTGFYDFPSNVGWHTDWYGTIAVSLILITQFSSHVYPHIKSSWGGGQTLPITLYLNGASPVFQNQHWQVQLIDEAENGFYVLDKHEKKAVFVPRSAVSLVYFSDAWPGFEKAAQPPPQQSAAPSK
jgi:hypothetical protein